MHHCRTSSKAALSVTSRRTCRYPFSRDGVIESMRSTLFGVKSKFIGNRGDAVRVGRVQKHRQSVMWS
jgi:hypothetical protein